MTCQIVELYKFKKFLQEIGCRGLAPFTAQRRLLLGYLKISEISAEYRATIVYRVPQLLSVLYLVEYSTPQPKHSRSQES